MEAKMAELILHHYDFSPFSEKVRLAFGLKGLDWQSVETPMMAPKPDLVPLTAGFRRAPVLQVGADVYCDTLVILREIERRQPAPTLYPSGQRGVIEAFCTWWDRATFFPCAKLATSIIGDQIPAEFLAERRVLMQQDFSRAASLEERPLNLQRVHAAMARLTDALDGKAFIMGEAASAADITAYHTLWFARRNGGAELEAMLPLDPLRGWMDRVAAIGHGRRHAMDAQLALRIAHDATPAQHGAPADADPAGLKLGERVAVRADDYARDPVHGTLVSADATTVVIRHDDPAVGVVHLHFPRIGYEMLPA
jgi:glutathione S-transferase